MKLHPYKITPNSNFIGRQFEWSKLDELNEQTEAQFLIVYGKKGVGKTELVEQYFKNHSIFKFKGHLNESLKPQSESEQIAGCLHSLSKYLNNSTIADTVCPAWTDLFKLVTPLFNAPRPVLFIDELQWLSNNHSSFMKDLKLIWEEQWKFTPNLKIVLCSSSPSMVLSESIKLTSLYSKTQEEIQLKAFSVKEAKSFLKSKNSEVMMAQLLVGGVITYLKRLKDSGFPSILASMCENTFGSEPFFLLEANRLLDSKLSNRKGYKEVLAILSRKKYAVRKELQQLLEIKTGGTLSVMLQDLEACGFIEKYVPLQLENTSLLARYCIADEYLNFYFRFIKPVEKKIIEGGFIDKETSAIPAASFKTSLVLMFERWCRKNSFLLAQIMKFDQVEFLSGPYFCRSPTGDDTGFQIDLMYIREDRKIVICEIIQFEDIIDMDSVYRSLKKKKELFYSNQKKYKNYKCEFTLITTEGELDKREWSQHIKHIITYEDIFSES